MANFPIETKIVPSEVVLLGKDSMVWPSSNSWKVNYNPDQVRNFLQAKGLKNQYADKNQLAEALLAGLLPDIFEKVFETGARPQSGYPCHDGQIVDTSRGDVEVVYNHGQSWDHYKTDPIKDGLGCCFFDLNIRGVEGLFVLRDWFELEPLLQMVFGERLAEVKEVNPRRGLLACEKISAGNDHYTRAFLEMYPTSPVHEDVSQAVELYRKVAGVIKGEEDKIKEFADLVRQGAVAEGLLKKVGEVSGSFNTAFTQETSKGVGYNKRLEEIRNFVESMGIFIESNLGPLRERVESGKQHILTDLTKAFEPVRDELVSYFTQPLYSTETR